MTEKPEDAYEYSDADGVVAMRRRLADGSLGDPLHEHAQHVEESLVAALSGDPEFLGTPLLVIGRGVPTIPGETIDLLALDEFGILHAVVVEEGPVTLGAVQRILRQREWLSEVTEESIREIFTRHQPKSLFDEAVLVRLGTIPRFLGSGMHRPVIVCSRFNPSVSLELNLLEEEGVSVAMIALQEWVDGDDTVQTRSVFTPSPVSYLEPDDEADVGD
ncbi:hypothetical protein [Plantibacter flavus]|nr:hypothetical protein [Plantibacter flavus]